MLTLHPLALLNISDYYSRESRNSGDSLFIGALLGHQADQVAQYAFEIKVENGSIAFESLTKRLELYRVIYPDHKFFGWFSIVSDGKRLDDQTVLAIHDSIRQVFDQVIVILLVEAPFVVSEQSNASLPCRALQVLEQNITEIPVRIDVNEAEWIASNDIVNEADTAGGSSIKHNEVTSYLLRLLNDVTIYQDKLERSKKYIQQIQHGGIEANPQTIAEIVEFLESLDKTSINLKQESYRKEANQHELFTLTETLMAVLIRGNSALSSGP